MLIRARRRPGSRGSVLMLMPAAVLIMVVLGAVVIDLAVLRMRANELDNAATAAANDAAAYLVDAYLYRDGAVVVSATDAEQIVRAALATRGLNDLSVSSVQIDTTSVVVEVTLGVEAIFGRAIPGVDRVHQLRGRGEAELLVDHTA